MKPDVYKYAFTQWGILAETSCLAFYLHIGLLRQLKSLSSFPQEGMKKIELSELSVYGFSSVISNIF